MISKLLLLLASSTVFAGELSWENVVAEYEVPAPAEMKALAVFPLNGVRARDQDGQTQLRYSLPLELTGREIKIRLSGTLDTSGSGELRGQNAKAVCKAGDCTLNYPGIKIEPSEVKTFLESRGFKGNELESRLLIAELFRVGDPAGILHIRNYP